MSSISLLKEQKVEHPF